MIKKKVMGILHAKKNEMNKSVSLIDQWSVARVREKERWYAGMCVCE